MSLPAQSPTRGTGLNTYGVSTLFYQTSVPGQHLREAHNDYLQLAAEGGLLLGVPHPHHDRRLLPGGAPQAP